MSKAIKPPVHLSSESKKLWQAIVSEYRIDDAHGLHLLKTAMECNDRMRQAMEHIKKNGAVIADKFGQFKPNPSTVIERDSRSAMLSALRALNLDLEPLRDRPGRPGGK